MVPMIGGKVEERQQCLPILDQAFDGLVVFGRVFFGEGRHCRFRRGPVWRHQISRRSLCALGCSTSGLVEYVQCLVQPASLVTGGRERLVEGLPKPERAIANGHLRRDDKPRAFKSTSSSFQL